MLDQEEQTKSLDANSSKDLKTLLSHSDDESETTAAKPVTTKHSSHKNQSSKGHSKTNKTAATKPSSATVTSSSQMLTTQSEAVKNESFLQASLGEINPVTQPTRLSSVFSSITPQDTPPTPPQAAQNNVSELVSAHYFVCTLYMYYSCTCRDIITVAVKAISDINLLQSN